MSWADIVNGAFESVSGLLLWNNVRILFKQKQVRGVSVFTTAVFAAWGYWNLYYYPSLGQLASFIGGILVVTANTAWVVLAIYYTKRAGETK